MRGFARRFIYQRVAESIEARDAKTVCCSLRKSDAALHSKFKNCVFAYNVSDIRERIDHSEYAKF